MILKTRESRVATVVTLLFVVASASSVYFFSGKDAALRALSGEKLKNEKMVSEKQTLSREIDKLRKDIELFKGQNGDLDKKLALMEATLKRKEDELRANARKVQSVEDYKRQLKDLQVLRDQLSRELGTLKGQLAELKDENGALKNALASMEANNQELTTNNYLMSQVLSENYGVEAHKKNDRLTVRARKTKGIELGFDVPMEMTDKLSFTITSPDGKKTASNNSKAISYTMQEGFEFSDAGSTASLLADVGESSRKKRVLLTYKPEEKLSKGIYKIDIFSGGTFIGSSQIRLR